MINYKIKSIKDVTIEELIGQVIMVGLPFDYLDDNYKRFIKEYKQNRSNSKQFSGIDRHGRDYIC